MRNLSILLIVLILYSCSRTYKLDESDKKLVPYSGNEKLIFKSSDNKMDTIFLKGYKQFSSSLDPLDIFPDKFEFYVLECKVTDPNYDRYLENKTLIELSISEFNETILTFNIVMKESWYYGKYIFTEREFDSIPLKKLRIETTTYDDVKIVESDSSYISRDNYVERFYWSLSNGLIGVDKKNSNWRLVKKIR